MLDRGGASQETLCCCGDSNRPTCLEALVHPAKPYMAFHEYLAYGQLSVSVLSLKTQFTSDFIEGKRTSLIIIVEFAQSEDVKCPLVRIVVLQIAYFSANMHMACTDQIRIVS